MSSSYGEFQMECPKCGKISGAELINLQIFIHCYCEIGESFFIPIPEGWSICEKCDGNKFLYPKDLNYPVKCNKCGGTGVTTWVDKVLR